MSNQKLIPALRFPEFEHDGEWVEKKLESYIDLFSGIALKSEEISDDESGRPILRGINITEGYIRHSKDIDKYFLGHIENVEKYFVKENDIVIGMDGSKVGKNVALIQIKDENAILIQRVARIRTNKNADVHFVYQYLISNKFRSYVDAVNTSSGIPHISAQQIKDFKVGIPPTPEEQQKIATCLSSLDEVIAAHSQKLELLKEHKKGLMQNLFPQEGEKVPKYRFKEFEKDGEWVEKKLGEVAFFINEKISVENLSIGSYISTENLLSEYAGVAPASKVPSTGNFTKYREQDILISNIRPYLKKVWFSNKEGGCSNDVFVIRGKSEISRLFLSFMLRNDNFINYVMVGAKGVKMPRGDKDLISKYPVPFPQDPKEQQKIASCLSSLDALITSQSEKIEQLKLHKKGLMQGLFPKIKE